jgi:hypothetical protein
MTEDGGIDLVKFPIDSILEQAMGSSDSPDDPRSQLLSACFVLTTMASGGRVEAGVFLCGLLGFYEGDVEKKIVVVEALGRLECRQAADVLFGELDKVVSSPATRVYIGAVLKALRNLPEELTVPGFQRMLGDKKWSNKMKDKFEEILEEKGCPGPRAARRRERAMEEDLWG